MLANGVMLVGDSPWKDEQARGTVFAGAAGYQLERMLKRISQQRENFAIWNTMQCSPPHLGWTDKPEKFPDAIRAIEHCRPHLDGLVHELRPRCIVPMGNVA